MRTKSAIDAATKRYAKKPENKNVSSKISHFCNKNAGFSLDPAFIYFL